MCRLGIGPLDEASLPGERFGREIVVFAAEKGVLAVAERVSVIGATGVSGGAGGSSTGLTLPVGSVADEGRSKAERFQRRVRRRRVDITAAMASAANAWTPWVLRDP